MTKLRVAGLCACVLEADLDSWTVQMLRQEVARRANIAAESVNLICAGKVLRDEDGARTLTQLGLKENAKILVSRVTPTEEGKLIEKAFMAEEERSRRLARVKAAAGALSNRHSADGSLPIEDFNIELEDQRGQKIRMGSEVDQRAVMMGLMLHANAKSLIRREKYTDALEVLAMAEEAFSLCDPRVLELVDNVPILQIDMVWCYFMLRDISWLSVAGVRLEKAREGLERAHGKDFSRVRLLQSGRHPELALHLRLELLEGVVAYHSGQLDKSRKSLKSAQMKILQLQVPDEALSMVMSMGFKEREARRALRLNNQNVQSAVDFLVEEKEKKEQRRKEDLRREKEIREQKRYGLTPLKKAVDLQMLDRLASIGYERELAAEALRRHENDFQIALDELSNPESNSKLQLYVESRKRKRRENAAGITADQLESMGFDRSIVAAALQAGGTREEIMRRLLSRQGPNPQAATDSTAASGSYGNSEVHNDDRLGGSGHIPEEMSSVEDPEIGGEWEQRDAEMEEELAEELAKGDALSDYDIEVTKEGEAIDEYLAMLASRENCGMASSSSH